MERRTFLAGTVAAAAAATVLHTPRAATAAASVEVRPVTLRDGKLSYTPFANRTETNADNVMPDFSYAGYRGGEALPPRSSIPVRATVRPGSGNDRTRIQNAIDQVSAIEPDAAGFRGAVLLTAGRFFVDGELSITASGVVLRGEGQGVDGTVVEATAARQHDLVRVGTDPGAAAGVASGYRETPGTATAIASSYVGSGQRRFDVVSTAGYAVGDRIVVVRTPDDRWISALDMAQYGWTSADYVVWSERRITAIDGRRITIDSPLVQSISQAFGGGRIAKYSMPGRISEIGIEDLRLVSATASSTDEAHGWNAIIMAGVQNSWVRNVTARYFGYSTVNLANAVRQVTVQDSAYLDGRSQPIGGRRYSFALAGSSTGNLFQRLYARAGRHDFVTGSRVPGPNVYVDCLAVEVADSDSGPHHRYATGLLLDNVSAQQLNVQNRKASGSGHGWAGAQTVFWNSVATASHRVETPPGARNWSIGTTSPTRAGDGTFVSPDIAVAPRSLYFQQLQDRLGSSSVAAVTTEAQRRGPVYDALGRWAGGADPLSR